MFVKMVKEKLNMPSLQIISQLIYIRKSFYWVLINDVIICCLNKSLYYTNLNDQYSASQEVVYFTDSFLISLAKYFNIEI
jgi:hypothetical protein